jgi:hypothetical protein
MAILPTRKGERVGTAPEILRAGIFGGARLSPPYSVVRQMAFGHMQSRSWTYRAPVLHAGRKSVNIDLNCGFI